MESSSGEKGTVITRRRLIVPAAGIILLVLIYLGISFAVLLLALTPLRKPHDQTPLSAGLKGEALTLESVKDRTPLTAYYLPGRSDRAIVMVHGLDSNCWDGNDRDIARAYNARGFGVILFDLRGQGSSGGRLLGLGWKERDDVLAAVNYLKKKGFRPGKIGMHGSSYGAGTALLAAAYIPDIGAVVADSPFADIRDMIDSELRAKVGSAAVFRPGIVFMGRIVFGLDLAVIPPVKAVPGIAPRPIFFIHGEADSRIPVENSRRLRAESKNPADILWTLPGVEHTREYNARPAEFMRRTIAFFDRYLK